MTDDLFLDEEFDDVDADCDGEAADEAAAPEPEFTSVYEFVETHLVYLLSLIHI